MRQLKPGEVIVTPTESSRIDAAYRGLRVVRSLPDVLEHAFRAAARESAFLRNGDADFFAGMRDRALFHFDRLYRESSVLGDAERARADLTLWVRNFATSPLRRRLGALPLHRLHLAHEGGLDLLAIGADGKRYAIRFVAFRSRSERSRLARSIRALSPQVDGLIVSSLDDGTLRHYRLAAELPKEWQRLR